MRRDPIRSLFDRLARRIAYEVHRPRIFSAPHDAYLAIATLRERHAGIRAALSASEMKVFSQNGEDGVIAEIFARIGTESRFFVEFGVEDGRECNTRFLADVLGWGGVYFEVDDRGFQLLKARMCNRTDIRVLQEMVTPENVNEVFAAASIPEEFDLLSIDIDGQDYWVWRALEGFRPRVLVIEHNSTLPLGELLVEPSGHAGDGTDYWGASLSAMEALGESKGYRLVHTDLTGVNAFFVRSDLVAPFDEAVRHGQDPFLRGHRGAEDPLGREYQRLNATPPPSQGE